MSVVGIDLGTTNSAIAYLKDGKPVIIENKAGLRTTPSVFQLNPNGEIVILDGLTLAVAESDASNWEGYKRGDKVTFRAVLGEPQTPFSAIELKTLKSGRSIIMLRVGNAMPAN